MAVSELHGPAVSRRPFDSRSRDLRGYAGFLSGSRSLASVEFRNRHGCGFDLRSQFFRRNDFGLVGPAHDPALNLIEAVEMEAQLEAPVRKFDGFLGFVPEALPDPGGGLGGESNDDSVIAGADEGAERFRVIGFRRKILGLHESVRGDGHLLDSPNRKRS